MTTRIGARYIAMTALLLIAAHSGWAGERIELKLWPGGAPGETAEIGPEKAETSPPPRAVTRVSNVSEPTITLFQAPADTANGCAVVVCPGGGYNILAWDLEGTEVAEWLNSIGVTAVVLKYRVPRRDPDEPHRRPLEDAQRAMRLTRQHAAEWGIDASRLGMLGFSAGGHLTVMTGTHGDDSTYESVDKADTLSSRPDFLIPIYAAYLGDKDDPARLNRLVRVTNETPPTFQVITHDDADRAIYAALLFAELKRHDVPAELHIFAKGGHGYGLRPGELPVSQWPKLCEAWLRTQGLLEPGGVR